uniref:MOSC domain-containing protein n=2 Tax=Clastoptera arizonana TaxID=38151 RepID=A0A1B6CDJ7_9HEMI
MINVPQDNFLKLAFLTTAAISVVGGYILWKQKKTKLKAINESVPAKWKKVGEVSKINYYPLKSGRQVVLNSAKCTEAGIEEEHSNGKFPLLDRLFVLFEDGTGNKITVREYPSMLLIELKSIDKNTVIFSSPGVEDLVLKIPSPDIIKKVTLWNQEKMSTIDCGDRAADWFTKLLVTNGRVRCRLGYYASDLLPPRTMKSSNWDEFTKIYPKMRDEYMGTYSDYASYMILSETSLGELNSRLDIPVKEGQFRPNIVVKGVEKPHEEDEWDWVKVGDDVILRSCKLCTRCLITTVNPDTATKSPDFEPLKTLRTYRLAKDPEAEKLEGQSPIMGIYLGLHRTGVIRMGDPVYVNCD